MLTLILAAVCLIYNELIWNLFWILVVRWEFVWFLINLESVLLNCSVKLKGSVKLGRGFVCVCVCVCVGGWVWVRACVRVCLCYFLPLRLLLTEQNKCNARVQLTKGMMWKYFCIKYLCSRAKDNHRKNLQAMNFKLCQLNWTKPQKVKDNSNELSETNGKNHEA